MENIEENKSQNGKGEAKYIILCPCRDTRVSSLEGILRMKPQMWTSERKDKLWIKRTSAIRYRFDDLTEVEDLKKQRDLVLRLRVQTPRKKFYFNIRNRFFNFISSIRSKNSFRTNINLFDFKKSSF